MFKTGFNRYVTCCNSRESLYKRDFHFCKCFKLYVTQFDSGQSKIEAEFMLLRLCN